MIEVLSCVVCHGPLNQRRRALVAPFLAKQIWNRAPFCVNLVECRDCGFLFYNPRLENEDLQRLYRNYRSDEYQKMRNASEAWYTQQFNYDLASPASYQKRRSILRPILQQHLEGRTISTVLDYGGDRGDLVAGLIDGAKAFVFDISGIPAAEGVTATTNPAECRADLVVNSNVLEHVGFPREHVEELFAASPDGGLIYMEVPAENPFESSRLLRRTAQIAVMTLTRPAIAPQVARPASLYMMHEHINYWNERTLTTLVQVCGGTVHASGAYPSSGRAGNADMAWCLASHIE